MVKSECTAVVVVTLGVVLGRHVVMASVAYRFSIPKGAFVFPFIMKAKLQKKKGYAFRNIDM